MHDRQQRAVLSGRRQHGKVSSSVSSASLKQIMHSTRSGIGASCGRLRNSRMFCYCVCLLSFLCIYQYDRYAGTCRLLVVCWSFVGR